MLSKSTIVEPKDDTCTLPEMVGFDFAKGLEFADHDIIFYKKLLLNFKKQLQTVFNQIIPTIINNEKEASLLIHTLKSISGTVGASELSNICFEIDAAYKASDPIPANMIKKLEREISIIQLSLESFNSEDMKQDDIDFDETLAKQMIQSVKISLQKSEFINHDIVQTVCAYLKILCDQDTSELFSGYVNNFQYEKAIDILDGLAVEDGRISKKGAFF
jgi:HPt (histidine-containing phosphotransfer) domain-containing protein